MNRKLVIVPRLVASTVIGILAWIPRLDGAINWIATSFGTLGVQHLPHLNNDVALISSSIFIIISFFDKVLCSYF